MHLHMVSMGWKWATLGSILEEGRAGLAFLHFTQCHSEVKKTNKQKTLEAQDQKESWQTLMCSQWGWHWTCYSSLALMAGANTAARTQPEVRWAWAWSLCKCPPTNTALVLTTVLPCLQHQDLFARLYVEDVGVAGAVAHHQLTWVATHKVHWRWNTRLCRKHHVKTLILFAVCHYTSCSCLHY